MITNMIKYVFVHCHENGNFHRPSRFLPSDEPTWLLKMARSVRWKMVMFHSFLYVYQRVMREKWWWPGYGLWHCFTHIDDYYKPHPFIGLSLTKLSPRGGLGPHFCSTWTWMLSIAALHAHPQGRVTTFWGRYQGQVMPRTGPLGRTRSPWKQTIQTWTIVFLKCNYMFFLPQPYVFGYVPVIGGYFICSKICSITYFLYLLMCSYLQLTILCSNIFPYVVLI